MVDLGQPMLDATLLQRRSYIYMSVYLAVGPSLYRDGKENWRAFSAKTCVDLVGDWRDQSFEEGCR